MLLHKLRKVLNDRRQHKLRDLLLDAADRLSHEAALCQDAAISVYIDVVNRDKRFSTEAERGGLTWRCRLRAK